MIILNELKAFFRDKTNLAFMILFPALMIYLLGNLLSDQDLADAIVGDLRIAYINETDSQIEAEMIDGFIKEMSEEENISFTEAKDAEAAKKQVAGNEFEALVVFRPDELLLYEGRDTIKNRTISAILTGYSYMGKAVKVIAETAPDQLPKDNQEAGGFVEEREFNANRSMLDYYGVTMVVLMIFMGAIIGANTFNEERRLKTMNRLLISPLSRKSVFLQKAVGQIPSAVTEIAVVMSVGVLFFKVHYAAALHDNILLIVLFLCSGLTMLSVGIVLGMFIKGNPSIYIMIPLWLMMFFSGTASKEIYIKGISDKLPVYKIQEAAFDITVFGRSRKAVSVMLAEAAILVVMLAVGIIRSNRMKEVRM